MKVRSVYIRVLLAVILGFASVIVSSQSVNYSNAYDDGLPRSTPEEQGVPSAAIARLRFHPNWPNSL